MSNSVTKIPKDGVQLSEHCTCILYDMYQCQGTAAQATFSPMLCKPLGTSWRMLTKKPFYKTAQTPCIYYMYATKKSRQVWQNAFQLTQSFFLYSHCLCDVRVKSQLPKHVSFDSCLWKGQLDTLLWLKLKMQDYSVPNQWVGEGLLTHFYGWSWRTIWYLTTTSCRQRFMINTIQSE